MSVQSSTIMRCKQWNWSDKVLFAAFCMYTNARVHEHTHTHTRLIWLLCVCVCVHWCIHKISHVVWTSTKQVKRDHHHNESQPVILRARVWFSYVLAAYPNSQSVSQSIHSFIQFPSSSQPASIHAQTDQRKERNKSFSSKHLGSIEASMHNAVIYSMCLDVCASLPLAPNRA